MRPNYGGSNEDNGDLLQKVPCTYCYIQCLQLCSRPPLTHTSARDSWTLTGKSGSVSCGVTAPFSYVLVCTSFFCALQESVSPVPCKFWWLSGGVNGNLLQEGFFHTQVYCTQSPCPLSSPVLTCTSSGDTQTQFCLSLCGISWSLYAQGLSSLSISGRCRVESKHSFDPPTILLGLLLCPWTWGISSKSLQLHAATAPALERRLRGYCLPKSIA